MRTCEHIYFKFSALSKTLECFFFCHKLKLFYLFFIQHLGKPVGLDFCLCESFFSLWCHMKKKKSTNKWHRFGTIWMTWGREFLFYFLSFKKMPSLTGFLLMSQIELKPTALFWSNLDCMGWRVTSLPRIVFVISNKYNVYFNSMNRH